MSFLQFAVCRSGFFLLFSEIWPVFYLNLFQKIKCFLYKKVLARKCWGSGNAHGCHARRTLPDVYFFAGFQGGKVNIVYFSAGSEAFKYTSQRSGSLWSWIHWRKNIRFQKRTVSGASPARASNPNKNVPEPKRKRGLPRQSPVSLLTDFRGRCHQVLRHQCPL